MNKALEICAREGIEVHMDKSPEELAEIFDAPCYPFREGGGYQRGAKGNISSSIIALAKGFNDEKEKEITLWHELGHAMHPLGSTNISTFTRELAANTWALANYEGGLTTEEVIEGLSTQILGYINAGYFDALNDEELKNTARILKVYDMITWVGVNNG